MVGKFCGVHGLAVQAVDRFGSGQRAVLGSVHAEGHGVPVAVVGDVAHVAVDLADGVGVLTDGVKAQRFKGHVALGIVGGGLDELAVLIQQVEFELARGQGVIAHIGYQRLACGQGHAGRGGLLNVLVLGLGGRYRVMVADLDLSLVFDGAAHSVDRNAHLEAHGAFRAGGNVSDVPGDGAVLAHAVIVGAHEFGTSGHSVGHGYGGGGVLQVLVLDGVGQLVAHFQGGVGILVSGLAGQVVVGDVGGAVAYQGGVVDLAVLAGNALVDLDGEAYVAFRVRLGVELPGHLVVRLVPHAVVVGGVKGGIGGHGVGNGDFSGCVLAGSIHGIVDPMDGISQLLAGAYQRVVDVVAAFIRHGLGGVGVGFVAVRERDTDVVGAVTLHCEVGDVQFAGAVVCYGHIHGVDGIVPLGDGGRFIGTVHLADSVAVLTWLGVSNVAEVAGGGIPVGGRFGQRQGLFAGQRGVLGTAVSNSDFKGKRFLVAPFAAYQLLGNGELLLAVQRSRFGGIGVGKGGNVVGFGLVAERILAVFAQRALEILHTAGQLAALVDVAAVGILILHRDNDLILGRVVDKAGGAFLLFGDVVGVGAGLGKGKVCVIAQRNGRVAAVGNGLAAVRHRGVDGVALVAGQHKGEVLLGQPAAAVQRFAGLEQHRGRNRVRVRTVGVGEITVSCFVNFAIGVPVADRAGKFVAFPGNRYGCRNIAGVDLEAGQRDRILGNGIFVGAGLGKGDLGEITQALIIHFFEGCIGDSELVGVFTLRHGGVVFGGQGKGELITVHPLTALKDLADMQCCAGRGRRQGVGKGDLAGNIVTGVDVDRLPCTLFILLVVSGVGCDDQFVVGTGFRVDFDFDEIGGLIIGDARIVTPVLTHLVPVGVANVGCGVGHLAKVDLTAVIVAYGGGSGHRGIGFGNIAAVGVRFGNAQGEMELVHIRVDRVAGIVFVDLGRDKVDLLVICIKDVLEQRDVVRGHHRYIVLVVQGFSNAVQLQLALAVIFDLDGHRVGGGVVVNAGNLGSVGRRFLVDAVAVGAGLGVGNITKVERDRGAVPWGALAMRQFNARYICVTVLGQGSVTRFESFQMEDELVAALPIAAAQNFLAAQVGLTIEDVRTRLIGVGHSNHRGGILDLTGGNHAGGGIDVGSIPVGRGRLTDGILAACGQALDLGGLAVFQGDDSAAFELVRIAGVAVDCVGVSAICAVAFQVDLDAELGRGIGAVGRVSLVDLLGDLQAAGGVIADLAVVAQEQETGGVAQVPGKIDAAISGAGGIRLLGADLFVQGLGIAALQRFLGDVILALFVWLQDFVDFFLGGNADLDMLVLRHQAAACVCLVGVVVGQVIIVRLLRLHVGGRNLAVGVRVDGGILGIIIEAVGVSGLERNGGVARRVGIALFVNTAVRAVKQVGVEVHLAVIPGMVGNVFDKLGVAAGASGHSVLDIILQADGVEDADGISVRDLHRDLAVQIFTDLIIAQGQQGSRDLDINNITGFQVVAVGDLDDDGVKVDVFRVGGVALVDTLKNVSIYRTLGGRFGRLCGIFKNFIVKSNGVEAVHGHVIAQGVVKAYIAAVGGIFARFHQRRHRRVRGGIFKNIIEYSVQLGCVFGGFVVTLVLAFVQSNTVVGRSGSRIVAGHSVHEFVFLRGDIFGLCAGENAYGVNSAIGIFYAPCGTYSAPCNFRLILIAGSRRTVGKENDNLFGICACAGAIKCGFSFFHA